jgi:hypothetical protein
VALGRALGHLGPRASDLGRPLALPHEAVLGRTVKRLALRAERFGPTGVTLALPHKAHLSRPVKRLAVRTYCLAITGLRRSRANREAGNQRR